MAGMGGERTVALTSFETRFLCHIQNQPAEEDHVFRIVNFRHKPWERLAGNGFEITLFLQLLKASQSRSGWLFHAVMPRQAIRNAFGIDADTDCLSPLSGRGSYLQIATYVDQVRAPCRFDYSRNIRRTPS